MTDRVASLDLGECVDHADLVRKLQERRADHLEALAHVSALTETRHREIALCEEVLTDFGEPFEVSE